MLGNRFAEHVDCPVGHGHRPIDAASGAAGGSACGDLVRVDVAVDASGRVTDAGFDARGCAALLAAGSATVALVTGRGVLDAARLGPDDLAAELGGLLPGARHAVELAADALHRALGAAVRRGPSVAARPGRRLVALSGGVDSAVAALLCTQGGGEVVTCTLELWADRDNDGERSCCSAAAVRGARALAHRLGLAHLTIDLREEFRAGVVAPFVEDHRAGLTPNPCVRCNGNVRLDEMLDVAGRVGAGGLVTGHYARLRRDTAGTVLRVAADAGKDQSYMLAAVSPRTLERLEFPLGELTKPRVRELAREAGLSVASKPDSQDLCFLAGTDRGLFLARHGGLSDRPGPLVDRRGRRLGTHRGHQHFTIGQRRGLGVARGEPLYVLARDARTNRVTVGSRAELRRTQVTLRGAVLHRPGATVDRVKLRYRSLPLGARLDGAPAAGAHAWLRLALDEPVDGAAPGQTACLMDGELIVGHATIAAP